MEVTSLQDTLLMYSARMDTVGIQPHLVLYSVMEKESGVFQSLVMVGTIPEYPSNYTCYV